MPQSCTSSHDQHSHQHGHGVFGAASEVIFSLLCAAFLLVGFVTQHCGSNWPKWLPLSAYLVAYFFGAYYTVIEVIDNLRHRRFEIDTLMLVAAIGAAILGAWAEGALLLFLFSLGHALEHSALDKARKAITSLAELAPETARVWRNQQWVEVAVETLQPGDVVQVRPNERLPADGFVVEGESSVNQAPITGESMPVDKQAVADAVQARNQLGRISAASLVYAGSINGSGALEVEVSRRSNDSTLARVVRLVSEADTRQSPTQRFTKRFERVFVPLVLLLAIAVMFSWVVVDEPFRDSFYRAMAVLVAASPCALAIATPSAVLSGIARAARGGVLVKGGAPLEVLGQLHAMAFDKTGTLTEGRPRVSDLIPAEGVDQNHFLAIAVAVQSVGDHPLAVAVARDCQAQLPANYQVPKVEGLTSLTGMGVSGQIDGQDVWLGKAEMFGIDCRAPLQPATLAAVETLREQGRTVSVLRLGDRDLGVIGLMDSPRKGVAQALKALRRLGIHKMVLLSGDHQRAAQAVGAEVGIDEARGDLMPEDKVVAINQLRQGGTVAMVGDGVNDAPAMAAANVGVAMGAAGSHVALETADVALMTDNLLHLPFVVELGRQTRKIIRQNLIVSLGMVIVLVPATIFGLGIGPAVIFHEGSTLVVVANALRLLVYKQEASA